MNLPTEADKRTFRPPQASDAGVPLAQAGGLLVIVFFFVFFLSLGADRLIHRTLDGPHWLARTSALVAAVVAFGAALVALLSSYWPWLWRRYWGRGITASTERVRALPSPGITVEQVTPWELQTSPNSQMRGKLLARPSLCLEWSRAAVREQSLSYATWSEKFGGDRRYAKFRQALVDEGLVEERGERKDIRLTDKGWDVLGAIVAQNNPTPLLAQLPLLEQGGDSDTQ